MHGKDEKCIQVVVRKPKVINYIGDLGIDGNIIIKRILKKQDVKMWNRFKWL
jgi:hypothetical protein